jgi:dTDP-4-dehydrorhamnose reductase
LQNKLTLVFGKDGQLGKAFQVRLKNVPNVHFVGRQACDLTQSEQIQQILNQYQPTVILNAAAYTAVDQAEKEPERAFLVNELAPQIMANYIATIPDGVMVHYSTDYVFDGEKKLPYGESDTPNPLGVYGKSKRAGEVAIQAAFDRHRSNATYFILRTSWVYGEGNNFIQTMLKLAQERDQLHVVADQWGVPTPADWLVDMTLQLIAKKANHGIYHTVPAGVTSWHGLAKYAIQTAYELGMSMKLRPEAIRAIPATDYPLPAPRPYNSRMDHQKLKDALHLVKFPQWQDQVREYVKSIVLQTAKSE